MCWSLAKSEPLVPALKAIRDRFQEGGSLAAFLLALIGMIAFVAFIYWLTRLQSRTASDKNLQPQPQQLFHDLLPKMDLIAAQRQYLVELARASSLKHPVTLLLCEQLFEQHATALGSGGANREKSEPSDHGVAELRRKLFPPAPTVSSMG